MPASLLCLIASFCSYTIPHGDESATQPALNSVLHLSIYSVLPLSIYSVTQPQSHRLTVQCVFKNFLLCDLTVASTPRNSHGQFLARSALSLPPSSSSSTESSLAPTPFTSPMQPHCTLDNTPPTSPAPQPPPPTTHTQGQLPAAQPPSDSDDEDMTADADFFFYGNGRVGENLQDFIKKFESKDLKDTMTEEKKTTVFANRLKSGNTAEEWFDTLPIVDKATWADVKRVFLVCWPKKTASLRSAHDKSNLLKGHILKEDELGIWREVDRWDELSHVIWADKALTLANNVPDPTGLLIPAIRGLLPEVIRERINSEFTNWEDFTNAVKAISKSFIDDALEKSRTLHHMIDESRAATAAAHALLLQQSPTAPLRHMLRNTTISQYPQVPLQQPQFHQHAPPPSPSPHMPTPAGRGRPPMHNNQAQAPFAFCTNELRAADAHANTLPQHANTAAGLALYNMQIVAWNKANPGHLKANEFCPYPLMPGTAPLGSNKCFGCGQIGHCALECPTPNSIPPHECNWHAVATIIFSVICS